LQKISKRCSQKQKSPTKNNNENNVEDKESDTLDKDNENKKLVPKYKYNLNTEIDQIISPRSIIQSKTKTKATDKIVNIHQKALNRINQYYNIFSENEEENC